MMRGADFTVLRQGDAAKAAGKGVPLVSVIPPGAQIAPTASTRINARSLGKIPGLPGGDGWRTYNWLTHSLTPEEIDRCVREGANFGVLAAEYPGIDIDVYDATVALAVERIVLDLLGPAPVRIGLPPKRLLMYRTREPFSRMALSFDWEGRKHTVEVLGEGRQYLVSGIHPGTMQAYTWDTASPFDFDLTYIKREDVRDFLGIAAVRLKDLFGIETWTEGDGRAKERKLVDQASLLAPTMPRLQEAVSAIPNPESTTRDEYIAMGYAVRAAAGEQNYEEGFDIFAEWAGRCPSASVGTYEEWRRDWERMVGPYSRGWDWVCEQAREAGVVSATYDFDPVDLPERTRPRAAAEFSDLWLAQQFYHRGKSADLLYAAGPGWYVWNGNTWEGDSALQNATVAIADFLIDLADRVSARGATDKERAANARLGQRLCSLDTVNKVRTLVSTDPRISVDPDAFDEDPWMLNTPSGVVDLRTGNTSPADPTLRCSKITGVSPDPEMDVSRWLSFLDEVTQGDELLQEYLQRHAGYCLTGRTSEQQFSFLYGAGGNGKGAYIRMLQRIMGSYAVTATGDLLVAKKFEGHPTELAMLKGARLVVADETEARMRFSEAKLKRITGGERITARFMYKDLFQFTPKFKILISGNHLPNIDALDDAMRRRVHLVPFTARLTLDYGMEFREDWKSVAPGVLSWAIEGCRKWQRDGLRLSPAMQEVTESYFRTEGVIDNWREERQIGTEWTDIKRLYSDWRTWARENGLRDPGDSRYLSKCLRLSRVGERKHPETRRVQFALSLAPLDLLEPV